MEITKEFVKENKDKRFTVTFENGKVMKNIKFYLIQELPVII